MTAKRVAIVTGANRGLGFGTACELARRGYKTVFAARDLDKLRRAVRSLVQEDLDIELLELDVTRQEQVDALASLVADTFGRADVLVNNAGILLESTSAFDEDAASALRIAPETVLKIFETNTLGAYRMCQAIIPLMRRNDYGRIVNISSGMGQLSDMGGAWPGYRMSKTALNALTRIFAAELAGTNIKVNSICPGWVRTDMGGAGADRAVEEAIVGIAWAATLPDEGPSGGFFRDRQPIPW